MIKYRREDSLPGDPLSARIWSTSSRRNRLKRGGENTSWLAVRLWGELLAFNTW